MQPERRAEPRVLLRRPVEAVLEGGVRERSYTTNLSRGGVLVELSGCPVVGIPIGLRLELTKGEVIEVRGTVRHATRVSADSPAGRKQCYLVGVKFESVDDPTRKMIEETLSAEEGDD